MKLHAMIFTHGLLMLAVNMTCVGQKQNCPNLDPENSSLGYRKLPNRCEGYFIPKYASKLQVACFTKGHIQYELKESTMIVVRAANAINTPINIRAVSLLRAVHYQMDASLDQGKALSWPVNPFLYQKELKAEDIGVYGWTGSEADKVFIPVTVSEAALTGKTDSLLRVVVIPVTNLTHFRWRYLACEQGECRIEKRITGFENYKGDKFAGTPMVITLPAFAPGMSRLCMEVQYRSENKAWEAVFVKLNLGE